jgi:hypothetical protein
VAFRIALGALWIATSLAILVPSAVDPDLWGHVLFGRMLLAGPLPATNGLAYTAADHPWVNHEILAEVFMASTYETGGAPGLVGLKVLLGLGTLLIVWRTAAREASDPVAAAVATAVTALVMAPGFMIRPQLFTLLFLASTLGVLQREGYRARGRAWALPVLMVLWVNTHGGVLAGVGLAALSLGTAALVDLVARRVRARDVAASAAIILACVAALAANPYGTEMIRFLLHDVTPTVAISEWKPVPLLDTSFLGFKALLVVVAVAALRRRIALPALVVVAATAVQALLHRRHVPLFAIAAAPILACQVRDLGAAVAGRMPAGSGWRLARAGIAVAAVLQIAGAGVACWRAGGRIEVDPRVYPVQALRFLAQNAITGNVALPFRWGEYALWSLPAGGSVAVDGRFTTAYPGSILESAWAFMSGGPGWDALLNEHPTDVVVTDRHQAPAQLLRHHPEWEYVYSDPLTLIFVRKVPSQADTLARFHAGTLRYDRSPLDTTFPAAEPVICPARGPLRTARAAVLG